MDEAKRSFEDQWGEAFDQAEQAPPAHIWTALDAQLANQEAKEYKKRLLIFQWSAAACVALLALFGVGYWASQSGTGVDPNSTEITSNPEVENDSNNTPSITSRSSSILPEENKKSTTPTTLDKVDSRSTNDRIEPSKPAISLPLVPEERPKSEVKSGYRTRTAEPHLLASMDPKDATFPSSLSKPALPYYLYGVPNTSYVEEKAEQQLWAGISMGSGSFDPAFKSPNGNLNNAADFADESLMASSGFSSLSNQEPSYDPGYSLSAGLNVGTRLANRIILSTGLHYQAFNTADAETQLVSQGKDYYALTGSATDDAYNDAAASEMLRAEAGDVSLSNEYRYLTVPIRAGYVVLDKKLNIILNAGMSSNFLMDAYLENHDNNQSLSNDFNTTDNYQSVYFNINTGIEFAYQFFKKYQITLEPNYNQALTNFTNSNHSKEGKPRNIGLSFGVKYNF